MVCACLNGDDGCAWQNPNQKNRLCLALSRNDVIDELGRDPLQWTEWLWYSKHNDCLSQLVGMCVFGHLVLI